MNSCPFCGFTEEDVVVYGDERCFAAVSRDPINRHHLMVIPREHYRHFVDLPDDVAGHLFVVAKRLSVALRQAVRPEAICHISDDDMTGDYNLVAHYKLHLIPRFADDGVATGWARGTATRQQRASYAADIRSALGHEPRDT